MKKEYEVVLLRGTDSHYRVVANAFSQIVSYFGEENIIQITQIGEPTLGKWVIDLRQGGKLVKT